ncbi:DUF4238 domain-containing protein [Clostridium perfringens]|uniref:DUF4238 domain-containing protein n=1 Tax=Clostridium perfringens TaxID=1502 RepID=UPI000E4D1A3C|nr:DUF4238 domain-containing protein [Clostridium perfringens]
MINTNTRNVASSRYFYKINNLTYHDCKLIHKIFVDKHQEPMKSILGGWIIPVEKVLVAYDNVVKHKGVIESLKEEKELLLRNLLEELYANIEMRAILPLSKVQSGDISFITESDYENEIDIDFILYLVFQYFRTNKIKQSVKESVGELSKLFNDFDDAFNLIVPILSTMFGYTIYKQIKNKELYCYYIENTTETDFITGDQPVINTKAKFSGETDELELYYPVSPSGALFITKEENLNTEWSMEKVKEYNDMIERQSLELIFANDEDDLKTYIVE